MNPLSETYRKAIADRLATSLADRVIPDHLAGVARHIADQVAVDEAGHLVQPVPEIVEAFLAAEPWWLRPKEPQKVSADASAAGMTVTERMIVANRLADEKEREVQRAKIHEIAAGKNPFASNSKNLTAQMLLRKHAPDLADRLAKDASA